MYEAMAPNEFDRQRIVNELTAAARYFDPSTICKKCEHPIFQREDGTWDLVYLEWRPSVFCSPLGEQEFDTDGHEPKEADC